MKYNITTLLVVLTIGISFSFAQKKKGRLLIPESQIVETTPTVVNEPVVQTASKTELAVYRSAMNYYDYETAISALHRVIGLPGMSSYKDTLLNLYFITNRTVSASLLGEEIIAAGNASDVVYSTMASIYKENGLPKKALEYYEMLFKKDPSIENLYNIAMVEFDLGRYTECTSNLNAIVTNPKAENETITIFYDKNKSQEVPYVSAAYNIWGVVAMRLKEDKVAQNYFEQSLAYFDNFELARNNLRYLIGQNPTPEMIIPSEK